MSFKPMSSIGQIAYIVPDLQKGIEWWTGTMGIGPFYILPPIEMAEGDYRGKPHKTEFGAAIAYSGDVMVELIEPRGPSIYQEFIESGAKHMHHVCVFNDTMAEPEKWITERGGKRVQGFKFVEGSEIAYFEMPPDGALLEVICAQPAIHALFDAVKQAAANWDGVTQTIDFTAEQPA